MDLLFPDNGLPYQLQAILTAGVKYNLFTNNYVPTLSTVLADLTVAAWSGYAAVSQSWSDYSINGVAGHSGFAIAPPISFLNSSGGSVNAYGYYVTDSTGAYLLAVARFDSAPVSIAPSASLNVLPTWGDLSQLSS